MPKLRNILLIFFVIVLPFTSTSQAQKNAAFNKLLEEYSTAGLSLDPLSATQRGETGYNDKLPNNISTPFLKKVHEFNKKYQKKLSAFKREELSSFDKISFDIINLQIEQALQREQFHFEYMPFNQFQGLHNTMPSLGSGLDIQPFKTVKDYENWLKRIDGFTDWADTAIANFNKGIAIGMVLPRALVLKMITQLEAHTITDTAKNLFYGPLRMFPSSFSAADKQRLSTAYKAAITNKIIPAYIKLHDYVKNVYLPKSRSTSGYNALPNGDAMYRHLVAQYTTTTGSPEEIYQTGLNEVKRITNEIDKLRIKTGFSGTNTEFLNYSANKQFFPFKTDEEILDSFRAILPVINPNLKKLFNIVPKAAFAVKAIDKFKAATSAANYQRGSEDGSRPGYFNVPITDPTKYNKLGMENLFLHEAIPGHHFQLSIQQENKALPRIRKFAVYSAFSEGWALYVESLGDELGVYTDPFQKLAAYKSELFRAIRLVTDVSLHTGKMTREEAIKYMMETGGRAEAGSVTEVERYMAYAGQALSYKTGELKIQELKLKYQKLLGSKFNIKDFHDAILLAGSMPLTVFETYMEEWAKGQNK